MISMRITLFSEMVEANGKTVRENNMEIPHNLRVGQLVEVKYTEWHGGGACSKIHARLWIVLCGRDCDGTPLYWLGQSRCDDYESRPRFEQLIMHLEGGFDEKSLTPVEVTPSLEYGHGSLKWDESGDYNARPAPTRLIHPHTQTLTRVTITPHRARAIPSQCWRW